MFTKVSPLTENLRSALPESWTGVAVIPPRAPVNVWKFPPAWRRWGERVAGALKAAAIKEATMSVDFIFKNSLDAEMLNEWVYRYEDVKKVMTDVIMSDQTRKNVRQSCKRLKD